jgi:hypothetical protein
MPHRTVGRTSLPPAVCLSRHHAGVQTDVDARDCAAAGTTSPLTSSFTALLLRLHQSTTHSAILSAVAKNATAPLLTSPELLLCRR